MIEYEKQTIDAVKKVLPAVVSIVISKHLPKIKRMPMMPFFGPFMPFGMPGMPEDGLPGDGDGGDDQFIPHPHHKSHGGDGEKLREKFNHRDTEAQRRRKREDIFAAEGRT